MDVAREGSGDGVAGVEDGVWKPQGYAFYLYIFVKHHAMLELSNTIANANIMI